MVEDLLAYLSKYSPIEESTKSKILSLIKTKTFKKKEYILREGQMCNNMSFIMKGLVRIYYIGNDGEELCSGLLSERDLPVSVESFFNRVPSSEFIQAIEETTLVYITYDELESLYREHVDFKDVGRNLITAHYVQSERRNMSLRKFTAKEKYEWFQEQLGHLASRVPRKDIASYLGMTLETLSRMGH